MLSNTPILPQRLVCAHLSDNQPFSIECRELFLAHRYNQTGFKSLPRDLLISIACFMIPFKNREKIIRILKLCKSQQIDINFPTEFKTLSYMSSSTTLNHEMKLTDSNRYFRDLYGQDPIDQLINFFLEFNMLPSKMNKEYPQQIHFINSEFVITKNYFDVKKSKHNIEWDLSNLSHHRLPSNCNNLKNLCIFRLSNCDLSSLPYTLIELKNLTFIDLSNNPLTRIPPVLWEMRQLQKLDLTDCPISIEEVDALREKLSNCTILFEK